MILVTGGAALIGANFVLDWLAYRDEPVLNLDKLTCRQLGNTRQPARRRAACVCAGRHRRPQPGHRPARKIPASDHPQLCGRVTCGPLHSQPRRFHPDQHRPALPVAGSGAQLLADLPGDAKATLRFAYVSTDDPYGSLSQTGAAFTEEHRYKPNGPCSARDYLVRSYHHTYGLPVVTTNCSNNYGPYHFPEKLIPLMVVNALAGKLLPVYGDGLHVRDWLYVRDHCSAIRRVLGAGKTGEVYNIGGWNEKPNIEIVHIVCNLLDELSPREDGRSYQKQITSVTDRPDQDGRYANDTRKIKRELGWTPAETFDSGIQKTVHWYLANPEWVANVQSGAYREWVQMQYVEVSAL